MSAAWFLVPLAVFSGLLVWWSAAFFHAVNQVRRRSDVNAAKKRHPAGKDLNNG